MFWKLCSFFYSFWRRRSYIFKLGVRGIVGAILGFVIAAGIIKCFEMTSGNLIDNSIVKSLLGVTAIGGEIVAMLHYLKTKTPYYPDRNKQRRCRRRK